MHKYEIRNSDQALAYLTECNLATVSSMAMKKSRSKYEFKRQIEIAQTSIDLIVNFKIATEIGGRVSEVIGKFGRNVNSWAEQYAVE